MPKDPEDSTPPEAENEGDEPGEGEESEKDSGEPVDDAPAERRKAAADRDDEDDEDDADDADEDDPAERAVTRSTARAESDDADEDEEEDEAPPPPARRSKAERLRRKRLKLKKKRPKRPLPRTELEINAPDPQTLWMLGALSGAVLLMWGAARFACNAHPDETKQPREIATKDIASDPKAAAIELELRRATQNFAGALELAKGELATELEREKQKCDSAPGSCDPKKFEGKVVTTGQLLSRSPTTAIARVTTSVEGKSESRIVTLEPETGFWKAVSRRPDTGEAIPALRPSMPPTAVASAPAPSAQAPLGSAPPAASAPPKKKPRPPPPPQQPAP
jgi:hypothetical protein